MEPGQHAALPYAARSSPAVTARPRPLCPPACSDARDAEDAVRGRDGYDFYGSRLRVEIAKVGCQARPAELHTLEAPWPLLMRKAPATPAVAKCCMAAAPCCRPLTVLRQLNWVLPAVPSLQLVACPPCVDRLSITGALAVTDLLEMRRVVALIRL